MRDAVSSGQPKATSLRACPRSTRASSAMIAARARSKPRPINWPWRQTRFRAEGRPICSPRVELVDGVTKAGVLLWIEWIPRQDELVSGAASLALKRRPEKDWADDQQGVSEPMHAATPQVSCPDRRWSSDPDGVPIGPTADDPRRDKWPQQQWEAALGASSHRLSLRYSVSINVSLALSTAAVSAMRCSRWSQLVTTSTATIASLLAWTRRQALW